MIVVVSLTTEIEIEVDDKFKAIDKASTAKDYFTDPMCEDCCKEVCQKIMSDYPELLGSTQVKEIYSSESLHTLYESF